MKQYRAYDSTVLVTTLLMSGATMKMMYRLSQKEMNEKFATLSYGMRFRKPLFYDILFC